MNIDELEKMLDPERFVPFEVKAANSVRPIIVNIVEKYKKSRQNANTFFIEIDNEIYTNKAFIPNEEYLDYDENLIYDVEIYNGTKNKKFFNIKITLSDNSIMYFTELPLRGVCNNITRQADMTNKRKLLNQDDIPF